MALTLTLAERTAAGDHVEATVHLLDNDGRGLVVSDATPEVPEGGSAAFTVALGSRPTASVTVTVSVAAGDLSAAPAALTFTRDAWSSPQSVELTAARDTDFLADAPVAVTLTAADGGYDGQSVVVTATIVERDRPTLAVADAFAREGDGAVNFSVTLDRPGSGVVTVDYVTADGSATAPGDYIATSGVLRFAAEETARTIRVPVRDDVADDVQESATFTLTLRNATNAAFASNAAGGHRDGDASTTTTTRGCSSRSRPPSTRPGSTATRRAWWCASTAIPSAPSPSRSSPPTGRAPAPRTMGPCPAR